MFVSGFCYSVIDLLWKERSPAVHSAVCQVHRRHRAGPLTRDKHCRPILMLGTLLLCARKPWHREHRFLEVLLLRPAATNFCIRAVAEDLLECDALRALADRGLEFNHALQARVSFHVWLSQTIPFQPGCSGRDYCMFASVCFRDMRLGKPRP